MDNEKSVLISPQDARHVLWFRGYEGGYEPGGFTKSLLETITKADAMNKIRLREVFPGLVDALDEEVDYLQYVTSREER